MAVLITAIHVLLVAEKTWMPGTSPGMTTLSCFSYFRKTLYSILNPVA
jgi:hypothetical protein